MTPDQTCGPGEAWVGSFGSGAACLDEEGWKIFDETNTPLTNGQVSDIAVCGDGTTWLTDSSGLVSTDGETWVNHSTLTANKGFDAVACDPKKGVWLAGYEGVYYFDGESMTTHAASELGTGKYVDQVKDVAVASDGRVWAVTANSVATWDGTAWRFYEKGKGFKKEYFFEQVLVDDKDRAWVTTGGTELLLYDGKKWSILSQEFLSQAKALAVDPKNRLWVGTYSEGASSFDGKKWTTYNRDNSDLPSNHVRAIASDAKGRIWFGTEWGLAVLDGKKWTVYHMSDSEIRDNEVYSIAVAERGPTLPALAEKDPGTLTGRVVESGDPKSGLKVEACVEFVGMLYSGATPCADQAFHKLTTTNDDGVFAFPKLPVGRYAITVRGADGKWLRLTDQFRIGDKEVLVQPGETNDLGDLDIAAAE
jgi:ligand-binding sensor domain-containing protein